MEGYYPEGVYIAQNDQLTLNDNAYCTFAYKISQNMDVNH